MIKIGVNFYSVANNYWIVTLAIYENIVSIRKFIEYVSIKSVSNADWPLKISKQGPRHLYHEKIAVSLILPIRHARTKIKEAKKYAFRIGLLKSRSTACIDVSLVRKRGHRAFSEAPTKHSQGDTSYNVYNEYGKFRSREACIQVEQWRKGRLICQCWRNIYYLMRDERQRQGRREWTRFDSGGKTVMAVIDEIIINK